MLSLTKLKQILQEKGLTPIFYLTNKDNRCLFIQVTSFSFVTFFIYIPSAYEFIISDSPSYVITEIEEKEEPEIEEEGYEDNVLVSKNIPQITTQQKEKNLTEIVSISLKQFVLSLRNIAYKIAVTFENTFSVINRHNEVVSYVISTSFSKRKRIYVCIDLESFIDTQNLVEEVSHVNSQLIKVFEKSYSSHLETLKLLSTFSSMTSVDGIYTTLKNYGNYIFRLENLIEKNIEDEKNIISKNQDILGKYKMSETGIRGLFQDEALSFSNTKIMNELKTIVNTRVEMSELLNEIREKRDDLLINSNSLFLKNESMVKKTLENLKSLEKIIKSD